MFLLYRSVCFLFVGSLRRRSICFCFPTPHDVLFVETVTCIGKHGEINSQNLGCISAYDFLELLLFYLKYMYVFLERNVLHRNAVCAEVLPLLKAILPAKADRFITSAAVTLIWFVELR